MILPPAIKVLPLKPFKVQFIVDEEDCQKDITFLAHDTENIKWIIAALAAFHSGDNCECYINDEKAVLESDHGLL